jgi:hypothetical protein
VSTATHTPTPWAELEMPGRSDRIVRDDEDCSLVCEFSYGLNADSAFIVRACNAHDDLVAALRLIAEFPAPEQDSLPAANMRELARAALAKVGAA